MPVLTPLQIGVIAAVAVVGWLSGFFSRRGGKKWRKRFEQERTYYAHYRAETDAKHKQQQWRIVELEGKLASLEATLHPAEPPEANSVAETPASESAEVEPAASAPATLAGEHAVPEMSAADLSMPEAPHQLAADVDHHHAETVAAESDIADASPEPAGDAETSDGADHDVKGSSPAAEQHTPAEDSHAVQEAVAADAAAAESSVPTGDDLTRLRGLDADLQAKLTALGVHHFADIEKLSAEDEIALEERLGIPAGHVAREQWRSQAALLRAGNEAEFNDRYGMVSA